MFVYKYSTAKLKTIGKIERLKSDRKIARKTQQNIEK